VRELRNAVEGACVLAAGEVVRLEDFEHLPSDRPAPRARPAPPPARARARAAAPEPSAPEGGASITIPLDCSLEEAERRIILAQLAHHRTRVRAARALGIGLRTLYTKLARWGGDGEDAETA
jgi:DNA-binding NtrC family response regulator